MNYENLKHVSFLKHMDQKIWVETWEWTLDDVNREIQDSLE